MELSLLAATKVQLLDFQRLGLHAHLKNSSAAALMAFKLERSNFRNIASFPVASLSSLMAVSPLSEDLAARYTLAL
jgi:hypothetical protein